MFSARKGGKPPSKKAKTLANKAKAAPMKSSKAKVAPMKSSRVVASLQVTTAACRSYSLIDVDEIRVRRRCKRKKKNILTLKMLI